MFLFTIALMLTGCEDYGLTEYEAEPLEVGAVLHFQPADGVLFPMTPPGGEQWSKVMISAGSEDIWIEEIWLTGAGADSFDLDGDMPVPRSLPAGVKMPINMWYVPETSGPSQATLVVGVGDGGVQEVTMTLVGRTCADDNEDGYCD